MTFPAKFWLGLLAALLSACATTPPSEQAPSGSVWQAHAAEVVTLENWFLKGRIAIRAEQESWTATLHWRQRGDQFSLRVMAPLGQGTVELFGREGGEITLITNDNERYTAVDAESLMNERLGWSVPVKGLTYWIRGLPAKGGGITQAIPDSEGRIQSLDQMGWHLEINEYSEALGRQLPRKLRVNNDHFELKLVVQSWEQPDA